MSELPAIERSAARVARLSRRGGRPPTSPSSASSSRGRSALSRARVCETPAGGAGRRLAEVHASDAADIVRLRRGRRFEDLARARRRLAASREKEDPRRAGRGGASADPARRPTSTRGRSGRLDAIDAASRAATRARGGSRATKTKRLRQPALSGFGPLETIAARAKYCDVPRTSRVDLFAPTRARARGGMTDLERLREERGASNAHEAPGANAPTARPARPAQPPNAR